MSKLMSELMSELMSGAAECAKRCPQASGDECCAHCLCEKREVGVEMDEMGVGHRSPRVKVTEVGNEDFGLD